MAQSCQNWSRLTPAPDRHISNFILLDDNNVITAPSNSLFQSSTGIQKYNVKKDEWQTYIKYAPNYHVTACSMCFNDKQTELCIFGKAKSITKINLKTNEFSHYKHATFCGRYPSLFYINGSYHIICGAWNMHHFMWNQIEKKFVSIYRFPDLIQGNQSHGLVHIKSKKQLILFGGLDRRSIYLNAIWKCQYGMNDVINDMVYEWKKLDLTLPHRMHSFGYVLSDDERYILIFGGKVQSLHFLNEIYIFDLKLMTIKRVKYVVRSNHNIFVLKDMNGIQRRWSLLFVDF